MSACQHSHIEAYLSSAALDQGWRSDSQPSVVLVNDLIPDPFRLTDPKLCVFMWNVTDTTLHGPVFGISIKCDHRQRKSTSKCASAQGHEIIYRRISARPMSAVYVCVFGVIAMSPAWPGPCLQGLDAAAPHYSSSKEDDSGPETPAGPH
ncbi:hypothetical protein MHYP_G00144550 [Metynnis hypsauchen]